MQPTPNPDSPASAEQTPAGTLRRAVDYLQRYGWTRGAYYTGSAACALGAIGAATLGHPAEFTPSGRIDQASPDHATAYYAAVCELAKHLWCEDATPGYGPDYEHNPVGLVSYWNDYHGYDAGNVVHHLAAAATEYDQEHNRDSHDPQPVAGPCWSAYCIASFCDGINHVDATGYVWTESHGGAR